MADTGFVAAGTTANDGVGDTAWSNLGNAAASDNSYMTAALGSGSRTTQTGLFTNFGFSIPAGATIDGVEVLGERKTSINTRGKDQSVKLIKGGTVSGNEKANATAYTTSDVQVTYGGPSDLWGLTLTPSDVNASNFGVAFRANNNASGSATVSVDVINIKVYYTLTGNVYNDSFTESITLTESLSATLTVNATTSDGITPGNTMAAAATMNPTISDAITLGESLAPNLVMGASISDSITLTESLSTALTVNATTSDSITPGNTMAANATMNPTTSDAITLGESLAPNLVMGVSISDSITLGDSNTCAANCNVPISDALTLGQTLSENATINATTSDGVTLGNTLEDQLIPPEGGGATEDPFRGFLVNTGRLMRSLVIFSLLGIGGFYDF